MTPRLIANHFVDLDPDGYLTDPLQWDESIALDIAVTSGIPALTERHWTVIRYVRSRYLSRGDAPTIRAMGRESGVSVRELYQLFPKGPARLAARIGGIPKPHNVI